MFLSVRVKEKNHWKLPQNHQIIKKIWIVLHVQKSFLYFIKKYLGGTKDKIITE